MHVTFYILTNHSLPDAHLCTTTSGGTNTSITPASSEIEEAFLLFICKLTEKIITKGTSLLFILTDNQLLLQKLDKKLWSFSDTSFIAHDTFLERKKLTVTTTSAVNSSVLLIDSVSLINTLTENMITNITADFNRATDAALTDIVLLNLTEKAIELTQLERLQQSDNSPLDISALRVLEVITNDKENKKIARDKYRQYQYLGCQLQVHNIK